MGVGGGEGLLGFFGGSDVFHYDLRGDSLGALSMWQRGLLNLIDYEGWIHRDCLILWSSDVFFFLIHRNLVFLMHPDVFLYFSEVMYV